MMNNLKNLTAALILTAFCLQLAAFTVNAQKFEQNRQIDRKETFETETSVPKTKIAPDLVEKTLELENGFRADEMQRVIIQLKSETGLNEMFGNNLNETEKGRLFSQKISLKPIKNGILISD